MIKIFGRRNDVMKKEDDMNTTKMQTLGTDELESVSGGVLTEDSESYLNIQLTDLKKNCKSRTELIELIKQNYDSYDLAKMGISLEEAEKYALDYYDFF